MATIKADPSGADWMQAFRWLAFIETGSTSEIDTSVSDEFLRQRTRTLVTLLNILPRSEMSGLPQVIRSWNETFGTREFVSLQSLRQVGREVIRQGDEASVENALWQRVLRICQLPTDVDLERSKPLRTSEASIHGQRRCAEGLLRWLQELQSNPYWNTLPGVIPGDPDMPLEEIYVDLSAIEDSEAIETSAADAVNPFVRVNGDANAPTISMESMVARTLDQCVVVGNPGSGKSTLLKWLVWATFHGKLPDFDLAVEVKLNAFSLALSTDPELTPLSYFFRSFGLNPEDASDAAVALRQSAKESKRFLLLLDGWDEVPARQRNLVKQRILSETCDFVSVITSRPAGLPRQLLAGHRDCCYRIAGLTEAMGEMLTSRLLQRFRLSMRASEIWSRIRDDLRLREMASNPFLLGLLVRTLVEPGSETFATRATMYRRIVDLIRLQDEVVHGSAGVLLPQHLDRLGALSFRLLNNSTLPRYVFTRRELETCLNGLDAEPVLRSRFVTRPLTSLDEYSFLHATIQEFLAAEHVSRAALDTQQEFMNSAFYSTSRFIVLEFMAGFDGAISTRIREAAFRWWQQRDLYQQLTFRVAKLAAAGAWPVDEFGSGIRSTLWAEISRHSNDELNLCRSAVEAYVAVDVVDLIRRVKSQPPSSWAINCLVETIPASLARMYRMDELLSGEWRDVAGLDWMGGATESEREALHNRLNDWSLPAADLREAVLQAGSSGDHTLIPVLCRMAYAVDLREDVREEAVICIGRIGGHIAVHALIDILLDPLAMDLIVRLVAVNFMQLANTKLRLDPRGRDRLLRRLATLSVSHPRSKFLLMALEGLPIRDGAEVIAEFATSAESPLEVSHQAIATLQFVADRQLLEQLLFRIEARPEGLTFAWLELCWNRCLKIPIPWLTTRISRCRNTNERDQLVRILVQVLNQSDSKTRSGATVLLDLMALRAMTHEDEKEELSRALIMALHHVEGSEVILFSDRVRVKAIQVIALTFRSDDRQQQQQQLFAIEIVRHFRDRGAVPTLLRILGDLYSPDRDIESGDYQLLSAAGECVAELSPGELLKLSSHNPGVVWALRRRSQKRGWLVFSDRILNAEGTLIGSLCQHESSRPVSEAPSGLLDLLTLLTPQMRRVLESYWLMVWRGGPCLPGDSYPSIYETAKAHYNDDASEIGQRLRDRFVSGFPKFDAWKKQLTHAENKFSGQSDARRILEEIGLYRR